MPEKKHPVVDGLLRTFGVLATAGTIAFGYGALSQRTAANELAAAGNARRLDAAEERERAFRDTVSRMAESVDWMKRRMELNQK